MRSYLLLGSRRSGGDSGEGSPCWDFGSQPSAFAVAPLEVLLRSLPPFPVYSLAGAVYGGKGGGEDLSGDCGNAGALRAGVGGLPGVLSTKVHVLLQPGGVVRQPEELDPQVIFWRAYSNG